ncbi:MAG: SusC/RagA family TonB-linked outer membrane protein [Saprospiraceae bacterium]|nr:SusC/RagA family TonB-linked outer membrane protein [Saprospiraceae bacterium]
MLYFLHTSKVYTLCMSVLLSMAFTSMVQAQSVSGKVTDKDGEPLPGAAVQVKGTLNGTVTDIEGYYQLTANADDILVISYIGMENQEVAVLGKSVVNVIMDSDVKILSEVIVTALGIKEDRKNLSYSAQSIGGKELQETQRDNAVMGLQGRVAGLSLTPTSGIPGSSINITLRGVNSIGNSNQPLFVVDGLPINSGTFDTHNLYSDGAGVAGNVTNNRDDVANRVTDINPNDIENITVLKGPEAAALYGNEGANGVILITTKKGKVGSGRLNYSNRFTTSAINLFPETQTTYARGLNGKNDLATSSFFGEKISAGTKLYDNIGAFYQNGSNSRHDLSFDGGTQSLTYRLSGSYFDTKGVIPESGQKQLNVALNMDAQLLKNLRGSARLNYISNNSFIPPGGANGYLLSVLNYPQYIDITDYLNPDGTRKQTTSLSPSSELDNPLFLVNKNKRTDNTNRTISNVSLTYDPLSWFSVTARMGADIYSSLGNRFYHPESVIANARKGFIENYSDDGRILNGNIFATLKKKVGKIGGSLLVGTSIDDRESDINATYGENLFLPDFNSINNTSPTTQRGKSNLKRTRLLGAFAKAEINLNDLLIFNLTGRNDWSSTLPVSNRSYFYPSAGVSFLLTSLPMFKDNDRVLSFAKLRASYAEVGNPAPAYQIQARLVPQTSTGGGFLFDFYGDNPALKPETVSSYEIGGDFSFYKGLINLDLAWFSKSIVDQIVTQRLSYGTGFIFGLLNGGELNTKGFEVQLGLNPFRNNKFDWNLNVNFTTYATKVVSLPAQVSEYYNSDTWVYDNARASAFSPADILAARFNSPTNRFYAPLNSRGAGTATAIGGFSYLRNSKGDVLINATSGLPLSNANFLPIGDRNPDFTIGLVNKLTLNKNLSLSFLVDIRKGGDIFNGNAFYLTRSGLSLNTLDRETPFVVKGVLKDGKEESENPTVNTIAIDRNLSSTYYTTSIQPEDFVERDINWVRLRDLTLKYDFPASMLKGSGVFKSLGVFVNGTDLFLSTNYSGADPYVSSTTPATGGAGGYGFDYGKLSLPKTFSVGVNLGL